MNWIIWIAFIFLVLGSVLNSHKNEWGWVCFIISAILWVVYGVHLNNWPIIIQNLFCIGLNLYGIFQWQKDFKF
jgi:membrane protease YdiL (CAAX protease family)